MEAKCYSHDTTRQEKFKLKRLIIHVICKFNVRLLTKQWVYILVLIL